MLIDDIIVLASCGSAITNNDIVLCMTNHLLNKQEMNAYASVNVSKSVCLASASLLHADRF